MRIFAGIRWRSRGVKWERGHWKMAIFASFAHWFCRTFTWPQLLYSTYYDSHLVAFQRHRNRWPWITVSGYLALKSVFGWASNELACSGFRAKLFRERLNDLNLQRYTVGLRILALYCQRQKNGPGNLFYGSRFMQIFAGLR